MQGLIAKTTTPCIHIKKKKNNNHFSEVLSIPITIQCVTRCYFKN